VRLHANKHTVQIVAMTITKALEVAVSRMQLQLHSLPVKRWRKRKSAGGNRHLQDAKMHARQILLEKWQEAGWRTVAPEGPPASARSFTLSAAFWLDMVCADGTGTFFFFNLRVFIKE